MRCYFGNKRKTITDKFKPYKSAQKNFQYIVQKHMTIDIDSLLTRLFNDFSELSDIENAKEKIIDYVKHDNLDKSFLSLNCFSKLIAILSNCSQLYNHTFKCSEAYGRIYMPFQSLSSKYRDCIRIGQYNSKIVELYDIKCCFVQLSVLLALEKTDIRDERTRVEYYRLLNLVRNDIYSDILKFTRNKSLTRKDIKVRMLSWLFETQHQRTHSNDPVHNLISRYFQIKFPSFFNFVHNYEHIETNKILRNNKKKKISKLSIDCFEKESKIMFDYVIPKLRHIYNDEIVFITLHDGIFVKEGTKIDKQFIEKTINQIILSSFKF